jgi:hypothetical protein
LGEVIDMRCIDADALEKEGWSLHRTIRVDKNTEEYQTKPLRKVSTIEPERNTGRWINHAEEGYVECPFCHSATNCDDNISELHFCFSCGARMEDER